MRLGLVSDTHDNAPAVRRAVAAFEGRGVEVVLHAGDVTEPETLALFGGFRGAVAFGNNDRPDRLRREADAIGWEAGASWRGRLGGLEVALVHGHDRRALEHAIAEAELVVTGHTHHALDSRAGRARVVNPGALYRAPRYTAAVLDTRTSALESVLIPKTAAGF